MKSNKVVICGCQQLGVILIEQLESAGIHISYIVTITKEKAIEQNVSGYVSYLSISERFNIPLYYAKKYSLKSLDDELFFNENKFDLLIQGGWQRLFPDFVLNSLRVGAIGVHGSSEFLPKGRGRSPINWSLIEGRERFIFHYFLMKTGIDDGDIFHTQMVDINHWDDCDTIYLKNALVTSKCIISKFDSLISGSICTVEQIGEATYYPKRMAEDGRIDFSLSLIRIYNFIRGITIPYPGAFGFVNGFKILIWEAQPFDSRIDSMGQQIGEVVYVEDKRFVMKVVGGLLLVTRFEIEQGYKIKLFDIVS